MPAATTAAVSSTKRALTADACAVRSTKWSFVGGEVDEAGRDGWILARSVDLALAEAPFRRSHATACPGSSISRARARPTVNQHDQQPRPTSSADRNVGALLKL